MRRNTQNELGRFPKKRWHFKMIWSTILRFKSYVWVEHGPGCGKFHSTWLKKSKKSAELWITPPLGHNDFAWAVGSNCVWKWSYKGMPKVGITYMHVYTLYTLIYIYNIIIIIYYMYIQGLYYMYIYILHMYIYITYVYIYIYYICIYIYIMYIL